MTVNYSLLTDMNGKPLPQIEDAHSAQPQAVLGAGGSSSIIRGRWWQVGSGATTTSIPMMSQNGYTLTLTAQVQSQLVGSLFECLIGSTLYQAIVTAVSSAGTLTLDFALGSAPPTGTQFLLTPPDQTELSGSNTTFFSNIAPQSTDQNIQIGFTSKKIIVKNDGGNPLNFTLDGNPSTGYAHPWSDTTWSYTGTWINNQTVSGISGVDGTSTNESTTANSTATFKPTKDGYAVTIQFAEGNVTCNTNLQVSSDGGTTWVNPSSISGITRSDGATGTGLNSFSTSTASPNATYNLTFNFPYPSSQWAVQLTLTSGTIYLCGSYAIGTNVFVVKSSESLEMDSATSQMNVSSASSTTGRVYAI